MALHTIMDKDRDLSWDWLNRSEYGFKHVSPAGYLSTDLFNFKQSIDISEWNKLKKITTVRNPWSRMYDFYSWHFTMDKKPIKTIEKIIYENVVSYLDYNNWINCLEKNNKFDWWGEIFNQEIMRRDCNYVVRYENLQNDMNDIFPDLIIPPVSVSHPNDKYCKDDAYLKYTSKRSKEIIQHYCINDINDFGYQF